MGFETVVLNRVAEVLDNPTRAGFTNGTLFVSDLTSTEAFLMKEIISELTSHKVVMSTFDSETAFDFTE
jgi:uncharacterized protein (UPF0548 family)